MILFEILLVLCGILAASALIISKKPNAAELIAKITPAQGILGAIVGIWAIWAIIDGFRGLGALSDLSSMASALGVSPPGLGKTKMLVWDYIISGFVGVPLGFLLAYGLIEKNLLSKNPAAAEKAAATRAKLTGIQIPLGLAAIVLGLLAIILRAML